MTTAVNVSFFRQCVHSKVFSSVSFILHAFLTFSHAQESEPQREDVSGLVSSFIDAVPSFEAVWRVDESLSADPEFANYLDFLRSEQLSDYVDKENQDAVDEVDQLIAKQNEEIRSGLSFSYKLKLKYFDHQNYVIDYLQEGWEFPVQYFSAGDGVVFEVNQQNKEVRIKPYERYSLSSIVYGVPQVLLAGLTNESQGFSLEEVADLSESIVNSSAMQSDWRESAEALISAKVNPDTLRVSQIVRFYRYQAKGKESYEDMPITRILFSDYIPLAKSSIEIPQQVEVLRRHNVTSSKIDESKWELIKLQPSNDDVQSCVYLFEKGYTVIDHRTDPHRVFKSDDVISPTN